MKDILNDAMQDLIEVMAIAQSLPYITKATEEKEVWRHDALLSVLETHLQMLEDTLEAAIEQAEKESA